MENLRDWNEHNSGHDSIVCDCSKCHYREAGRMISSAYVCFVFWNNVYRLMCQMAPIEAQMRRVREQKARLAPHDERMWASLMGVVFDMMQIPMNFLMDGIPTSPRLRHRFWWDSDLSQEGWRLKLKASAAESRVYRLFLAVFHPHDRNLHTWNKLVQEIQYMMESDADASQYLDSWIASQFSDLALISDLLMSIDSLAPYFDKKKAFDLREKGEVEDIVEENEDMICSVSVDIPKACAGAILMLDLINKRDFEYPADKTPSKANSKRTRSAERCLDKFWWMLEQELEEVHGLSLKEIFDRGKTTSRVMFRTPLWRDRHPLPTSDSTSQKTVLAEIDPNAGYPGDARFSKRDFTKTSQSKVKLKTRGAPAAPDPRSADYHGPCENAPPAASVKIKISKRAFNTFSALLPSTSSPVEQRCELAWDDALFAMDAIGFESEKLYGSVWMFKPLPKGDERRKVDVGRSIQFHAPREVNHVHKITVPMVRTYGRRLKHAFGWASAEDMFEIDE